MQRELVDPTGEKAINPRRCTQQERRGQDQIDHPVPRLGRVELAIDIEPDLRALAHQRQVVPGPSRQRCMADEAIEHDAAVELNPGAALRIDPHSQCPVALVTHHYRVRMVPIVALEEIPLEFPDQNGLLPSFPGAPQP